MWKKYILASADSPGMSGFITVVFPFVVLGALLAIIIQVEIGFGLIMASIPLGVILAIVTWWQRDKHVTRTEDFESFTSSLVSRGEILRLLRIEDGRVVETGYQIWGKENIYPVAIPHSWEKEFETTTSLSHKVGEVNITVGVSLKVYLVDEKEDDKDHLLGYVPQELYEVVVQNGHRSVKDWLADSFKKAAESTPAVQLAMETNHGDVYALMNAVQQALGKVSYSKRLSNIQKVEVTVTANSAIYQAKATY